MTQTNCRKRRRQIVENDADQVRRTGVFDELGSLTNWSLTNWSSTNWSSTNWGVRRNVVQRTGDLTQFDELEFDELGFDELGFNKLRLYQKNKCYRGKNSPKNMSVHYIKTAQSYEPHNRRKSAQSGVDVTITIFGDFRQFSAKKCRFSRKNPML
jgi:hypothetical protein